MGESPSGSARDKGEDGDGENEGDLTRLVDKIWFNILLTVSILNIFT